MKQGIIHVPPPATHSHIEVEEIEEGKEKEIDGMDVSCRPSSSSSSPLESHLNELCDLSSMIGEYEKSKSHLLSLHQTCMEEIQELERRLQSPDPLPRSHSSSMPNPSSPPSSPSLSSSLPTRRRTVRQPPSSTVEELQMEVDAEEEKNASPPSYPPNIPCGYGYGRVFLPLPEEGGNNKKRSRRGQQDE